MGVSSDAALGTAAVHRWELDSLGTQTGAGSHLLAGYRAGCISPSTWACPGSNFRAVTTNLRGLLELRPLLLGLATR